MPNPTSRTLLEQYARRDPKAQSYLKMYDTISKCGGNPKQCAKDEAKKQLVQYLSDETGVPAGQIMNCSNDAKGCAKEAGIQALAAGTGVSPEVINLALSCAETGDSDQCAKAGLILVGTAACTAYTSGVGAYACSKAVPILVNFAWPHINAVINMATFGIGLGGLIDIFTFGQGLDFIVKPLGGLKKLAFGPNKSRFSYGQKFKLISQLVEVTQGQVNSAIGGLWDGMIAARKAQGLPLPAMHAEGIRWAQARWAGHWARRKALGAAFISARDKHNNASGLARFGTGIAKAAAQQDINWFHLLDPPWETPEMPAGLLNKRTWAEGPSVSGFGAFAMPKILSPAARAHKKMLPLLAKRERFIYDFRVKLNELGFSLPATRTSQNGKTISFTGGHWAAWGYKMCSNCTERDVRVFGEMCLNLFMERRISKIEPAVVFFIDKLAKDMARDQVVKDRATEALRTKAGNWAMAYAAKASAAKAAAAAPKPNLTLPRRFGTSRVLPKFTPRPLPMFIRRGTTKPADPAAAFRTKPDLAAAFRTKPDPAAAFRTAQPNPFDRAWEWSKDNPEFALPAAGVVLAVVGLAASRLLRPGGFIANALTDYLQDYECPCGQSDPVNIGYKEGSTGEAHIVCGSCFTTIRPKPSHLVGTAWRPIRHTEKARLQHYRQPGLDKCFAQEAEGVVAHRADCRPAKPRCRWMRELRKCYCSMYPWEGGHRKDSGRCSREKNPLRIPWPLPIQGDDFEEQFLKSLEHTYVTDDDDDPVPF